MIDLELFYKHDFGDTCTGRLEIKEEDKAISYDFDKLPFHKMMSRVSRHINDKKVQRVFMQRTDREGLKRFEMEQEMVELLRTDPVMAIRAMTVPHRTLDLRSMRGTDAAVFREKLNTMLEQLRVDMAVYGEASVLTVGADAIADSIGEEVYCRMRDDHVECPCCGMWVHKREPFECDKKCGENINVRYTDKWAVFNTQELLSRGFNRYYLPRRWNPSGGFIDRDKLVELYEGWKKASTAS